jgi:chitinase
VHFPTQGAFYSAIVEQRPHFTRYWDEKAKVPYLVSKEWQMVVSYDDEESVRLKAEYARDMKTRGVIIWEITADLMSDGTTPLLRTVASVLRSAPKKP